MAQLQSRPSARTLAGKTLFVTGASRGIGLAVALRAARDGARIVLAAKTTEPHPKLPGTLYTAAAEIESAGGEALAVPTDIRDEEAVAAAVRAGVERFGGIDILVNNASAISLTPTSATPMRRVDLLLGVNVRGTFCCTQACLSELEKSAAGGRNPHILNLSPPPVLRPEWFAPHLAYTLSKYGMSLCTLGHAAELKPLGIGVNSLWPRTAIATAALQMIPGIDAARCRRPDIVADAAWWILTSDAREVTGRFFIDEEVLTEHGISEFAQYAVVPGTKKLTPDLFVE